MNPAWDAALARERIGRLGLDPGQRAGKLSGGQRAQLALTLAIAKRPELLLLDEPIASLDPLARREFLQSLMEFTAGRQVSVVLSSHLVADLERVCDYLIVLVASRVQVAGEVEDLLATHHLLTGPRRDPATWPPGWQVISTSHTDRQTTLLVRTGSPIDDPAWTVEQVEPGRPGPGLHEPAPDRVRRARTGGTTMIWLTWRQFRAQAIAAAAALAVIAIILAVTGPHLAHLYDISGIATCQAHGDCGTVTSSFLNQVKASATYKVLYYGGIAILYARPALIGVFWGAPLVTREIEAGTLPAGLEPERHPDPLAGGQARPDRPGRHGHRRAAQPHDRLVGQPDRSAPSRFPGPQRDQRHQPLRPAAVRRPRHHPDRLRRVRLRPRRHRRECSSAAPCPRWPPPSPSSPPSRSPCPCGSGRTSSRPSTRPRRSTPPTSTSCLPGHRRQSDDRGRRGTPARRRLGPVEPDHHREPAAYSPARPRRPAPQAPSSSARPTSAGFTSGNW